MTITILSILCALLGIYTAILHGKVRRMETFINNIIPQLIHMDECMANWSEIMEQLHNAVKQHQQ